MGGGTVQGDGAGSEEFTGAHSVTIFKTFQNSEIITDLQGLGQNCTGKSHVLLSLCF